MKKMRNIFAAAMALVMAATMAGCTTQQAPETEQTNTAQTEEPNMRTVLQLGASRYEVSFRVPSDLAEYLSLTTFPEDTAAANILFTKGDQDGNIGRLVIYDAAEYDALKNELKAQGMDYVLLAATGCVGICQFEPVVEVYIPHQPRTTYVHMTPDKAVRVVQQHLRGGNPLGEYTIGSVQ